MKIATYGVKLNPGISRPENPAAAFSWLVDRAAECFDREPDFLGYPTYHGPENPDLKILMVGAR